MTDTTTPADEQSTFVRAFANYAEGKSLSFPQLVSHKEIFEAGWQARAASHDTETALKKEVDRAWACADTIKRQREQEEAKVNRLTVEIADLRSDRAASQPAQEPWSDEARSQERKAAWATALEPRYGKPSATPSDTARQDRIMELADEYAAANNYAQFNEGGEDRRNARAALEREVRKG